MLDYLWTNFGLLEWMLCLEVILLATAGFFYQVAKIIARTDRHDPLVKFYRVFWLAFKSNVMSVADLDLNQAQAMAIARGYGGNALDAPDLGDIGATAANVGSEVEQHDNQGAPPEPTRGAPAQKNAPAEQVSATFDAVINPMQARDALIGFRGGNVVVDVTCAPEDGHANGVIIQLIAGKIGVPPYQINLLRGHYKVLKTFRVMQIDQTALDMRLQRLG